MLPPKTVSLHPNVTAVQLALEAAGSGSRVLLLDEGVHTAAAVIPITYPELLRITGASEVGVE